MIKTCTGQRLFNRICTYNNSQIESIELNISSTIDTFKKEWNSLDIQDIFMRYEYLNVLDQFGNDEIKHYYVVMKEQQEVTAVLLFQLTNFNLKERIQSDLINNPSLQKLITDKLNYKVLVHGNLYLSGRHMNFFKDQTLSEVEKSEFILDIVEELSSHIKEEGFKVEATLIKDKDTTDQKSPFLKNDGNFSDFCVDPNMVLDIHHWDSIDSYLDSLKSKYRVRYRKAKKLKESGLTFKSLTLEDIQNEKVRMYELYKMTATEAGFNVGLFKKDYFLTLKGSLDDKCEIHGYYQDDLLIGFSTGIINSNAYSAHFLGFDKKYNTSHQLYLNILYDLVEQGIRSKKPTLVFSRTALEIKSTVGAIAQDLHCYIRLESRVKNKLVPYLLKHFIPKADWIPRSPFKENMT